MIIYSPVTMRDLIRNYKRIINDRNCDSDSDYEPLMSSTASSYGGVGVQEIFKQDTSSTESEEEVKTRPLAVAPFSIFKKTERSLRTRFIHESVDITKEEIENVEDQTKHLPKTEIPNSNYSVPLSGLFEQIPSTETFHYPDRFEHFSHISGVFKEDPCLMGLKKEYNNSLPKSLETFPTASASCENKHTHSSVVTIFAIWNTTMGSSLLAMAWGFEKTGLLSGILINIIIAALCLYTAYILLSTNAKHGIVGDNFEVPDLCKLLIGKWAEVLAKIFSILVLTGANIVYWVLMSNFLYNSVHFIYGLLTETSNDNKATSVVCLKEIILNINNTNYSYTPQISAQENSISTFDSIWDLYSTVPIFLAIIMFPLLNFKSPTFFTKFTSLGTLSVGYLLIFAAVKSFTWGINVPNWTMELYLKPTFCALSGMLSLSYFIHNIIISVMKHNRNQENNGRDLTIAFSLITFTYVFIGTAFYISFPLAKYCIEDNILNNFPKGDTMTIIARVLLLFQLFTVFPLISFMLRNDILVNLNLIWKKLVGEFSYRRVMIINVIVVFTCIMFACFLPRIGTLIRYTGALSGLVYIFLLPSLLKLASLKKEGQLTKTQMVIHIGIIIFGVLNLCMQFLIKDT